MFYKFFFFLQSGVEFIHLRERKTGANNFNPLLPGIHPSMCDLLMDTRH